MLVSRGLAQEETVARPRLTDSLVAPSLKRIGNNHKEERRRRDAQETIAVCHEEL